MKVAHVQLGLRENLPQFIILILVNAFVGGMVGLERTIMPSFASTVFHIQAKTAILSFITVFGISKAVSNYFSGQLAGKIGRKNVLIAGWILAIPIPFLMIFAHTWNLIIFTNILLGIHQGLTWSSTVIMKIDLVGEKHRGLAMGLNEFAGYLSVALMAMLTSLIAQKFGVTPYPFYLGVGLSVLGLGFSIFFVNDTTQHSLQEAKISNIPKLTHVVWETTWKNPRLGSVTQAGLVNNLNDGMVWGLLPILLANKGYHLGEIGFIAAVYPGFWGFSQLITGKLGDIYPKKNLLFWGMFFQGFALLLMPFLWNMVQWVFVSAILGIATALVYPTFLATISQYTHPSDRAHSLGVFRFWRDMGYAIGALATGIIADSFGINTSIFTIALLTLLSSLIIKIRFNEHEASNHNS